MNIALVVYSHYSRDARVRRYCESLARRGFKVDVICLKEEYHPKETNITLLMYPLSRRRFGRLWYILEYFLFFLYTVCMLNLNFLTRKYKIIHVNNMPDFLVFTAIIPKLSGSKIILDMHDPMPELYISKYNTNTNCFIVQMLVVIEKLSMKFADIVLTANPAFIQIFVRRRSVKEDKIKVILNCPDERIFNSKMTKIPHKDFNLYYMGTVDKRFGLDIAISAIPGLIQKIPNLKFVIIPKIEREGEYFKNIKYQISNFKLEKYIKIFPPQPLENIAKYLNQADVGIVLAKDGVFTENIIPVKLLEFIQMGIPVIATKTKVLSQYFDVNQIYFLKKNTPEEFNKAVLDLYKNKKIQRDLARNAKKYLTEYKWVKEEEKYLEIVNVLLHRQI